MLAAEIRERRRLAELGVSPLAHADERFEEQLSVFARIGLLEGDDLRVWRARYAEAGDRPAPWPADVVERALRHAEHLISNVTPEQKALAQTASQVLSGFAAEGILSPDETAGLRERLHQRMRFDPDRPRRNTCTRADLLDVLPGPGLRVDGVVVTSIECFADGVVVRWHEVSPSSAEPDVPRLWSMVDKEIDDKECEGWRHLTDDLGTRYRGGGGATFGINGGTVVRFGEATYIPAVPRGVRRLELRASTIPVELPEL